jgi:thiamine kinase-like enzyme
VAARFWRKPYQKTGSTFLAAVLAIRPMTEGIVRALPIWNQIERIEPLSGGVSNASYRVTDHSGTYVARVGKSYPFHQVDRDREAIAARAAFRCGLSPETVYAQDGIMVLRFVEARTYAEDDVRANLEPCVELVTRTHRDMSRLITGQGAIFWVFQILRDYGARLIERQHRLAAQVPGWMVVVDVLEQAQVPLPIIFGHHDLLPTNFLDDGKRLWLIDWEYGAFGTAMFDLANIASNNSFDEVRDTELLRLYFGRAPDQATLRAFYAMKTASALREAMWGMVSELYLNAPGVDYVAYAAEYLGRFERIHADYVTAFKS